MHINCNLVIGMIPQVRRQGAGEVLCQEFLETKNHDALIANNGLIIWRWVYLRYEIRQSDTTSCQSQDPAISIMACLRIISNCLQSVERGDGSTFDIVLILRVHNVADNIFKKSCYSVCHGHGGWRSMFQNGEVCDRWWSNIVVGNRIPYDNPI